jgi:hypothetical protein
MQELEKPADQRRNMFPETVPLIEVLSHEVGPARESEDDLAVDSPVGYW